MGLKSMTGFGRAEEILDNWSLRVEIKSLNHRFLEIFLRLPRRYQGLEEKIRRTIRQMFSRGRFEIYAYIIGTPPGVRVLNINTELAAQYISGLRLLKVLFGLSGELSISDLLHMRDIFVSMETEEDLEIVWKEFYPVFTKALQELLEMRIAEGKFLTSVLREQLDYLRKVVQKIEDLKERAAFSAKARLEERLRALLPDKDLDPARLHQEIVLLIDKTDITEELDRLRSHFHQFANILEEAGPHGRKLDFLLQEMFREINTLSTKASVAEISQLVVESKCVLEKMREQVQNIE